MLCDDTGALRRTAFLLVAPCLLAAQAARGQTPNAAARADTGPTPPALGISSARRAPGANAGGAVGFDSLATTEVVRGGGATIAGPLAADSTIVVQLHRMYGPVADSVPRSANGAVEGWASPRVVRNPDGTSVSFYVAPRVPLGRYLVVVAHGAKGAAAPVVGGPLHVATADSITVSAVQPAVSYPDSGTNTLTVYGTGFSAVAEDNALLFDGMPDAQLCPAGRSSPDCVPGDVSPNGRALRVRLPNAQYRGVTKVRVRVGDRLSTGDAVPFVISRVPRSFAWTTAAVVLALLTLLVYYMTTGQRWTAAQPTAVPAVGRRPAALTRRPRTFASAVFIDEQTNTYSLSKLQFILWTAVVLLGWVYLSAARSWVQGVPEIADVPRNVPGIVFIAAATSLASLGITAAKGSKGAGDPDPSAADFFTMGGVIAPERLQFFVWTVVSVLAFAAFTFAIDPGQIQRLPAVPDGLLYLSGLSAFGYLGGKLARKPGPVITDLSVRRGSLVIEVHGSNLSVNAAFSVVGAAGKTYEITSTLLSNDGRIEVVTPEDDRAFAKALRVTVDSPPATWNVNEWATGPQTLTLINPDGQKAAVPFTLQTTPGTPPSPPPPPVTSVTPMPAADGGASPSPATPAPAEPVTPTPAPAAPSPTPQLPTPGDTSTGAPRPAA